MWLIGILEFNSAMTQRKPGLSAFLSLLLTLISAPAFAVTATEAPAGSAPTPVVLSAVLSQTGLRNGGAVAPVQTVPGLAVPGIESVVPTVSAEGPAAEIRPALEPSPAPLAASPSGLDAAPVIADEAGAAP